MNFHAIDFSSRAAGHRPAARRLVAVSVICLSLAALGVFIGQRQAAQARALDALIAERNQAEESLRSASSRQDSLSPDAADAVNGVIRLMGYPLIATLDRLERHRQDDVRLMTIEAGPVRANLRLVVQASSLPRVLDYVEALQTEKGFGQLALVRQEASLDGQPARFTLEQPQGESLLSAASSAPQGGGRP